MNYHTVLAAMILAALSNTTLACDDDVMRKLEEIQEEQRQGCNGVIGDQPGPDC